MAKSVSEINARITANATQLNAELKRAERETRRFQTAVASAAKGVALNFAAAFSVGAMVNFTKSLVQNAAQIRAAARNAELSIEAYQTLGYAARDSKLNVEAFTGAIGQMRNRAQEAVDGSESAQRAFRALGLDFRTIAQLSPDKAIEALGRAIDRANDKSKAFAATADLIGIKAASTLTPALQKLGSQGFGAMAEEARKAGELMDTYVVEKLDKIEKGFGDFWNRVRQQASTAVANVASIGDNSMEAVGFRLRQAEDRLRELQSRGGGYSTPSLMSQTWAGQGRIENRELEAQAQVVTDLRAEYERLSREQERAADLSAKAAAARTPILLEEMRIRDNLAAAEEERIRAQAKGYDLLSISAAAAAEMRDKYWSKRDWNPPGLSLAGAKAFEIETGMRDPFGDLKAAAQTEADIQGYLDLFFGPLDEQSRAMRETLQADMSEFSRYMDAMWGNVSDRAGQAFADMVLTGKASFADLANIVARSMIEIVAKMAIINPLLNMVFGGFGGFTALPTFFGGGRASGGPVSAGMTYLVGEQGPELLRMGSSPGMVIPNRALREGGGSGPTVFIDARGADATAIARLEQQVIALNGSIEHRSVAAVFDAQRRRKI